MRKATACGAAPRYFYPPDLPRVPGLGPLGRWARDLMQTARTAEHPFNAGLMQEALVSDAQKVLNSSS